MFWSDDSVCVVRGAQHVRYELSIDRPAWPVGEQAVTLPDGLEADRRRKTVVLATSRRQRRLLRSGR